jgi:hypothetical protein
MREANCLAKKIAKKDCATEFSMDLAAEPPVHKNQSARKYWAYGPLALRGTGLRRIVQKLATLVFSTGTVHETTDPPAHRPGLLPAAAGRLPGQARAGQADRCRAKPAQLLTRRLRGHIE